MITCPSCNSPDRFKRKMTPHDPDGYLRRRGCAVPIVPCKHEWHNSPPPAFDVALSDVEIDYEISGGGEHTIAYITGLDDVAAAHRAEVHAAVKAEREACAKVDFVQIFNELQDHIIDMRDARMSVLDAANGIVVREKDGAPSHVVRMTTADAVRFVAERVAAAILARNHA